MGRSRYYDDTVFGEGDELAKAVAVLGKLAATRGAIKIAKSMTDSYG